ncbi:MAG: hypothetical protein AAGF47_11165 [Planctomycetota bacterium]
MTRQTMTGLAAACMVAASGSAAGQERQPTFNVDYTGPNGSSHLRAIDFGGGLVFRQFIFADRATNFQFDGRSGATRVVTAPDCVVGPEPMAAPDMNDSEAVAEFESRLTEVFANTALGNFVDNQGSSPWFSFVLEMEKPIKDNKHGEDDTIGEIIFFERGADVANSYILLEALDAEGNVMGTPYVIDPDQPISISPSVWVPVFGGNLQARSRSQEVGGVSVDLDKLGVAELSRLRVSRPTVGEHGMTQDMLSGGRDLNPDFKLVFVQTYDVALTGWFVGD